jgi:2-isopropylmalate synthase
VRSGSPPLYGATLMDRVLIFDTTLRDGEQAPGFSLTRQEKLRFARQLARLNVDIIEAGFPASSEEDFLAVCDIAREVGNQDGAPMICGLCRVSLSDIDRCWKAVSPARRPRIHMFVATSGIHMKYKLRMTPREVFAAAVAGVRHAKRYCEDVEFCAEDASRSDLSFLCDVLAEAIENGATTLNITDTVGYAMPHEWADRIAAIRERVEKSDRVVISVHCHNDLGHAVANSLAALRVGARQIECTINGTGERAGNAALEEIVMALHTRQDYFGLASGIQLREIYPTSKLLADITGIPVQPNKAIVGDNAFAHEAGIHQDGVLKDRRTYEIMRAQDIGRASGDLVIGKHSGRSAIATRLTELGLAVDEETVVAVVRRAKLLAASKKRLDDDDLIAIVSEVRRSGSDTRVLQ